jgi:hypothetical protein
MMMGSGLVYDYVDQFEITLLNKLGSCVLNVVGTRSIPNQVNVRWKSITLMEILRTINLTIFVLFVLIAIH